MSKYLVNVGQIDYARWRNFESERRIEDFENFIDGDLIESFLDLSQNDKENLLRDFKIDEQSVGHNGEDLSVNYFNKLVEELSRLH